MWVCYCKRLFPLWASLSLGWGCQRVSPDALPGLWKSTHAPQVKPQKAYVQTGWGEQEVHVEPHPGGLGAVLEGDIWMSKEDLHAEPATKADGLQAFGMSQYDYLWPDGVIPYVWEVNFDQLDEAQIQETYHLNLGPSGLAPYREDYLVTNAKIQNAMHNWMSLTPVTFKPRTHEAFFIRFVYDIQITGGLSSVGRKVSAQDTGQNVQLGPFCAANCITHELGHVLGLWHEQSRPDRDQYIQVLLDNVQDTQRYNFENKSLTINEYLSPYDLTSLMHYHSKSFSKNTQPTMLVNEDYYTHLPQSTQALFPDRTIPTPEARSWPVISTQDAQAVQTLYGKVLAFQKLYALHLNVLETQPDIAALKYAVKNNQHQAMIDSWMHRREFIDAFKQAFNQAFHIQMADYEPWVEPLLDYFSANPQRPWSSSKEDFFQQEHTQKALAKELYIKAFQTPPTPEALDAYWLSKDQPLPPDEDSPGSTDITGLPIVSKLLGASLWQAPYCQLRSTLMGGPSELFSARDADDPLWSQATSEILTLPLRSFILKYDPLLKQHATVFHQTYLNTPLTASLWNHWLTLLSTDTTGTTLLQLEQTALSHPHFLQNLDQTMQKRLGTYNRPEWVHLAAWFLQHQDSLPIHIPLKQQIPDWDLTRLFLNEAFTDLRGFEPFPTDLEAILTPWKQDPESSLEVWLTPTLTPTPAKEVLPAVSPSSAPKEGNP